MLNITLNSLKNSIGYFVSESVRNGQKMRPNVPIGVIDGNILSPIVIHQTQQSTTVSFLQLFQSPMYQLSLIPENIS